MNSQNRVNIAVTFNAVDFVDVNKVCKQKLPLKLRASQHLHILADLGSEGHLVVGRDSFEKYCTWLIKSKQYTKADIVQVDTSNLVYRFGSGKSTEMQTFQVPFVNFSCEFGSFSVEKIDVLGSSQTSLPFIAGYPFLSMHKLVIIPHLQKGFISSAQYFSQQQGTKSQVGRLALREIRTTCAPTSHQHPTGRNFNSCWLSLEHGSARVDAIPLYLDGVEQADSNLRGQCATYHNIATPLNSHENRPMSSPDAMDDNKNATIEEQFLEWDAQQRQVESDAVIAEVLSRALNDSNQKDMQADFSPVEEAEFSVPKKTFRVRDSPINVNIVTPQANSFQALSDSFSSPCSSLNVSQDFLCDAPASPSEPVFTGKERRDTSTKVFRTLNKLRGNRTTGKCGTPSSVSDGSCFSFEDCTVVYSHDQGTTGYVAQCTANFEKQQPAKQADVQHFPTTTASVRCVRKSRKKVKKNKSTRGPASARYTRLLRRQQNVFTTQFSKHNLTLQKVADLTNEDLLKIHLHGHAPVSRILKFLRATIKVNKDNKAEVNEVHAQMRTIKRRLERIIFLCPCSKSRKPHEKPRPPINTRVVEGYNEVVELDLLHVHKDELLISSASQRILSISCRGTGITVFVAVASATAYSIAYAFVNRWCNEKGSPTQVLWTDMGSEFLGEEFLKVARGLGLLKLVGAPRRSESHGFIEIRNRFLRQALRATSGEVGIDLSNLEIILSTFSNEYNNGQVRLCDGTICTPSLRAFGRSTSSFLNCLTDTVASPHHGSDILAIAENARSAWQRMLCDDKLRKILRTKAPTVDFKSFYVKQMVYYSTGGTSRRWVGPAIVVAINEISKYAHLDDGGILLHAHLSCLRPCTDLDCVQDNTDNSFTNNDIVPLIPDGPDPDLESESENPTEKLLRLSSPRKSQNTVSEFTPEFLHNFEHPCQPQNVVAAGPGARGFRASSEPPRASAQGVRTRIRLTLLRVPDLV